LPRRRRRGRRRATASQPGCARRRVRRRGAQHPGRPTDRVGAPPRRTRRTRVKLEPLPPSFASTRDALHAVAEHVVAAKRYAVDGHIGLEPTMGGFGTPVIDRWCARVEGASLVVLDADGERRAPITTLASGAAFVDGPLGAP